MLPFPLKAAEGWSYLMDCAVKECETTSLLYKCRNFLYKLNEIPKRGARWIDRK